MGQGPPRPTSNKQIQNMSEAGVCRVEKNIENIEEGRCRRKMRQISVIFVHTVEMFENH